MAAGSPSIIASPLLWLFLAVQVQLFWHYYSRVILHQTNPKDEILTGLPFVALQVGATGWLVLRWNFNGAYWNDLGAWPQGWILACCAVSAWLIGRRLAWMLWIRRKVSYRLLASKDLPRIYSPPWPWLKTVGLRNQIYDLKRLEYELFLPDWPEAWSGLTLVHLTDFHHGKFIHDGYLAQVRDEALRLRPHLLVLTGDFVSTLGDIPNAFRWLRGLKAKMGVYAVLGNHDGWTDSGAIAKSLRKVGIRVLMNEAVRFHRHRKSLALMGVDDYWTGDRNTEKLRGVQGDARILLAHQPDHFYLGRELRAHLQLSGHCHGGQVCLPGGHPLVAPSKFGPRYAAGFFGEGPSVLFANRGVGAYPPVRLFCPSEIVKLTLRSKPR